MTALRPLDAAFLRLETGHTSLHIASVAVFDGPMPERSEILRHVTARVAKLPRFGQRLREPWMHLGGPRWVNDPSSDVSDHLQWTALPHPGGLRQLHDLVGRLMAQPLDRSRPLWETWFVEGLEDGRWAMISKVHHSIVDGIGGADLLGAILDATPDSGSEPAVAPRVGRQHESLDVRATRLPAQVVAAARVASRTVRDPMRVLGAVGTTARGVLRFGELGVPAPSSLLTGTIGNRRSWSSSAFELDDVRTIKRELGGTVNDVVLAAVTKAFRDLLVIGGEVPDPAKVRALIPVSIRTAGQRGTAGNEVTAMVAELPVDVCSPQFRLEAVRAEIGRLKSSGEPEAGVLIERLAGLLPQGAVNAALSVLVRVPQRSVVTVVTNVPGPTGPLYLLGHRLRELYPYVPIADRLRLGVAIASYDGTLYFGVTADRDHIQDVDMVTRSIEDELRELLKIAAG
ncbi:MAG TPA: wax ester/triacylglycerol synthase family O-acyltransferase [Jatrophihabitantaceae bacterium]|jgi:diacylglycerol O-acyltransferase|nr:wax ester/triacylglycerol synthase family O-acyltransferase [Jatrophihabitantaceae bacterium]